MRRGYHDAPRRQATRRGGVRSVRLPVYWEELEPSPDVFDFTEVDCYLAAAESRGVAVLLSVGYKQPRWPECYPPRWAADLPSSVMQARILGLVEAEVIH